MIFLHGKAGQLIAVHIEKANGLHGHNAARIAARRHFDDALTGDLNVCRPCTCINQRKIVKCRRIPLDVGIDVLSHHQLLLDKALERIDKIRRIVALQNHGAILKMQLYVAAQHNITHAEHLAGIEMNNTAARCSMCVIDRRLDGRAIIGCAVTLGVVWRVHDPKFNGLRRRHRLGRFLHGLIGHRIILWLIRGIRRAASAQAKRQKADQKQFEDTITR